MSAEQRKIAYEKAVIKIAQNLEKILTIIDGHSTSMDGLARQIRLMPRGRS